MEIVTLRRRNLKLWPTEYTKKIRAVKWDRSMPMTDEIIQWVRWNGKNAYWDRQQRYLYVENAWGYSMPLTPSDNWIFLNEKRNFCVLRENVLFFHYKRPRGKKGFRWLIRRKKKAIS